MQCQTDKHRHHVEYQWAEQLLGSQVGHGVGHEEHHSQRGPKHFRGVCIAVARLFDLVQPSVTVFGLKDYQQYLIIKQLIEQEGTRWNGLKIIGAEIIRDSDGLAMSSRNIYLTSEQRLQALAIQKAIQCTTEGAMHLILLEHALTIEYAVIRDSDSLCSPQTGKPTRALVAVKVGNTRLIDNGEVQFE